MANKVVSCIRYGVVCMHGEFYCPNIIFFCLHLNGSNGVKIPRIISTLINTLFVIL